MLKEFYIKKSLSNNTFCNRTNYYFLETKVTIQFDNAPNTYLVKVNDGEFKSVEAHVKSTEQGLRLICKIGDKTTNVGLLTHDDEVHVYDEVFLILFVYCAHFILCSVKIILLLFRFILADLLHYYYLFF